MPFLIIVDIVLLLVVIIQTIKEKFVLSYVVWFVTCFFGAITGVVAGYRIWDKMVENGGRPYDNWFLYVHEPKVCVLAIIIFFIGCYIIYRIQVSKERILEEHKERYALNHKDEISSIEQDNQKLVEKLEAEYKNYLSSFNKDKSKYSKMTIWNTSDEYGNKINFYVAIDNSYLYFLKINDVVKYTIQKNEDINGVVRYTSKGNKRGYIDVRTKILLNDIFFFKLDGSIESKDKLLNADSYAIQLMQNGTSSMKAVLMKDMYKLVMPSGFVSYTETNDTRITILCLEDGRQEVLPADIYDVLLDVIPNKEYDYVQTKSKQTPVQNNSSKVEQLREFKSLLDDGIITQEEFDAKKKELLGL